LVMEGAVVALAGLLIACLGTGFVCGCSPPMAAHATQHKAIKTRRLTRDVMADGKLKTMKLTCTGWVTEFQKVLETGVKVGRWR